MSRKRKVLPLLENIEITGVAAEGKAIARHRLNPQDESPLVIFVPYGCPGDVADIKIDKKKHHYAEGHITELKKPSEIRIVPECRHFGSCGGCKWQHIPYPSQLEFKTQQVKDNLTRIGKLELPEIAPALPSENIKRYRNKMEYTFSNKRWRPWNEFREEKEVSPENENALGFHIPGAFDKVLQIEECLLQEGIGDKVRNFLYEYAQKKGLTFYDIKNNRGLLRTLMIRISSTGEVMVCVTFGEDNPKLIHEVLDALKNQFPEIDSLLYAVNLKLNDSLTDVDIRVYHGKDHIIEKMEDLIFRVNAKSFYQTNSRQAYQLYKTARKFAGLEPGDNVDKKPVVYDLYTGAGTIANFVARQAEKVIGIEYVEEAVEDAKVNSKINGIDNTVFIAGDMKDVLNEEFLETHGRPDVMIVDPPRAGMHTDVVDVILKAEPSVIVYVSCNPSTQARDLSLLSEKYQVTDVQPVDMFPHTHHVENIVRLKLINSNQDG